MKANYLEGDARAASIKNGEFLRKLHGDEKVTLVIRGFLAGHADVLTKLKGARYAFEYLQLVCDELMKEQNEKERAA